MPWGGADITSCAVSAAGKVAGVIGFLLTQTGDGRNPDGCGTSNDGDCTCAGKHSDKPLCSSLPDGYEFPGQGPALQALKRALGDHRLRIHSTRPTTDGPCPDIGTHINIRQGKHRAGSIVCCPCCTDTPIGPVINIKCKVV
jgi:hypothetical protein